VSNGDDTDPRPSALRRCISCGEWIYSGTPTTEDGWQHATCAALPAPPPHNACCKGRACVLEGYPENCACACHRVPAPTPEPVPLIPTHNCGWMHRERCRCSICEVTRCAVCIDGPVSGEPEGEVPLRDCPGCGRPWLGKPCECGVTKVGGIWPLPPSAPSAEPGAEMLATAHDVLKHWSCARGLVQNCADCRAVALALERVTSFKLRAAESALAEMTKERDEYQRLFIVSNDAFIAARQEREKLAEALRWLTVKTGCGDPDCCTSAFEHAEAVDRAKELLVALRLSPGAQEPSAKEKA
jgi:hypothetical protein